MSFESIISSIQPLDENAMQAARLRQKRLTKPPGSLGKLENLSIQMAGITGHALPRLEKKVILVMAGDHGVVDEGVSAYPQEVTSQMVVNFLSGGAAINVLARHVGARVVVADLGVRNPIPPHPDLINRKIAPGTGNIARGPAMSREQAAQSIQAGVDTFESQLAAGVDILATGEMGIGNTTPSAAMAAAFGGFSAAEIVGRGTGVDDLGFQRKIKAVEDALSINNPSPHDGLDILAKVGGFEIGGLAGAILAGAAHHCPILIDGYISTAAAMLAVNLAPDVRPYLIAAHRSEERGHELMLEWLELEPLLDLDLRLGEGTGAALALSLVEAACKILSEMATFDEAGVAEKGSN
jgi:nicotinate-nucleotide--dimethylbenzimidazole phosphoribosyltransferase